MVILYKNTKPIYYFKKLLTASFFLLFINFFYAQVGIGTTTPQGALDVKSSNLGLVVPRVTTLTDVTDGSGNSPVDGTIVYDTTNHRICYRIDGSWVCIEKNDSGNPEITNTADPFSEISNYIKSSNSQSHDRFGYSICISSDGNTLAIGSPFEDSSATGINSDQTNNNANNSGAVYVFIRSGHVWSQQAYIKASNTEPNDSFGYSLSLSADGNTLAVGAPNEASNTLGINGNQTNNTATNSGAVYLFSRLGSNWSQQDYIKASNTETNDSFGYSLSLSGNGNTLAVGTPYEASNATGINGDQTNNGATNSGAVYLFTKSGSTWTQEAFIKASNTEMDDNFGHSLSLSIDGNTLAVGAYNEDSNSTDINNNQTNNASLNSGAVYVFFKTNNIWSQEAYIKASNTDTNDAFGYSLSLSTDGKTLAIGALNEDSNATGINSNQTNNNSINSGAIYVFIKLDNHWSQQAYIKASNTDVDDFFSYSVSLSANGNKLVVGAYGEDSNETGINGNQINNGASKSGAVYIFTRTGSSWSQQTYIKSSNTQTLDRFGETLCLSLDGNTLAIGAFREDSNATGVNGDQANNSFGASGAVYIIE